MSESVILAVVDFVDEDLVFDGHFDGTIEPYE
jgi:hypothetical protein